MLLFATILNFITAYLIASLSAEILVIFVAFFALVILNIEILSLFKAISDVGIVALSGLFLVFFGIIFKYKKTNFLKFSFDFNRFKNALFLDKALLVLFAAFLFMLFITFVLAVFMPVLEPDSQTYHFLRAYEFLRQKSLNHFETCDIRALVMPINSEIFYTYMLALKKNFMGYGVLSYCSYLVCIFSSWKICEHFKFSFRRRLWAVFVFSGLSAIIIQIPSLQTDIVVGALLLSALSLYIDKKIFFSSLALALALGVKSTAVMALFGFFVLILGYEFLIHKKDIKIKKFVGFLLLNFLIFSSYNYILNFIHFHHPLANHASLLGHGFVGGIKGYVANLINFAFQALDFTGFKWGFYLNKTIIIFREDYVFGLLNIPRELRGNVPMEYLNIFTDEQVVGFGILGFLLFLPMVGISLARLISSKNKRTIFLALLAAVFLVNVLVLARACGYMVYSIRFIVAFVCLSFLILTMSYKKRSFLKPVFIFFCLFYMILISTHIKRMPVVGVWYLLKKNDFNIQNYIKDAYSAKLITTLTTAIEVMETIKTRYPQCKKIAYVRGTFSSVLYLKTLEKEGYLIDFVVGANVDKKSLEKYDLVILEKETQDDNTFNPQDVNIKYEINDKKVLFSADNKGLLCYYTNPKGEVCDDAWQATSRICLTHLYLSKKGNFKLDYSEIVKLSEKEGEEITVYYFINQIKD